MSRSLPSFEEVSAPVFVPAFLHTNLSCQQNVSSED
jgi:hypothetical protein